MIFAIRFELTTADLAEALVLRAELEEPSDRTVEQWVASRSKNEIREFARERLGWSGDPKGWPGIEGGAALLAVARETCQRHWPRGA